MCRVLVKINQSRVGHLAHDGFRINMLHKKNTHRAEHRSLTFLEVDNKIYQWVAKTE